MFQVWAGFEQTFEGLRGECFVNFEFRDFVCMFRRVQCLESDLKAFRCGRSLGPGYVGGWGGMCGLRRDFFRYL